MVSDLHRIVEALKSEIITARYEQVHALFLLAAGDGGGAQEAAQRSLAIAEGCQDHWQTLLARVALARVELATGRRDEARALANSVIEAAEQSGAARPRIEAEDILKEIDAADVRTQA